MVRPEADEVLDVLTLRVNVLAALSRLTSFTSETATLLPLRSFTDE
ncbi:MULTISPECIES: hypothetical protein [Haloferacaceae]|nr:MULTISPECIES: hypothetical protein [Haloferacales]MDX5989597.1 hypothetical protein [Haloferax mediterranei ATCC 33500]